MEEIQVSQVEAMTKWVEEKLSEIRRAVEGGAPLSDVIAHFFSATADEAVTLDPKTVESYVSAILRDS